MSVPSTTSATLWAHLLQKDKPTNSTFKTSMQIAPVDKAGTSVRLLLHDTQSTLEKFSTKVDKLITRVEDAQTKSQAREQEWVEEVERSTKLIVGDAVSNCKTCLQQSIGEPAQASQLAELRQVIVDHVGRLQTNIDTIRMLSQTQAQALQTIQDQQGQILTALLPLLPLLQAVPLHIDLMKNDLKDTVRSASLCNNNASASLLPQKRMLSQYSDSGSSPHLPPSKRMRAGFDHPNRQLPSPSRSRGAEGSSSDPPVHARVQTPVHTTPRVTAPHTNTKVQKLQPGSLKAVSKGTHLRQQNLITPFRHPSAQPRPYELSAIEFEALLSGGSRNLVPLCLYSKDQKSPTGLVDNRTVSQTAPSRPENLPTVPGTEGLSIAQPPQSHPMQMNSDASGSRISLTSQLQSGLGQSIARDRSSKPPSVKDFSIGQEKRFIPVVEDDEDDEDG